MARNSFWSRAKPERPFPSRDNMLCQWPTTYCTSIRNIKAKQMILHCSSEDSVGISHYWKGNIHYPLKSHFEPFCQSSCVFGTFMERQLLGFLFVSLFFVILLSNILNIKNCAKTTIMTLDTALLSRISLSTPYLPSFTIFLGATCNLDNLFCRGKTSAQHQRWNFQVTLSLVIL